MKKFISILRGINVGGKKIIRMVDLKVHLESLEFTHVNTYIQSGNIVFSSPLKEVKKIKTVIENKIEEVYKFHVSALVLSEKKLRSIISINPFNQDTTDFSKLYLTFLDAVPDKSLIDNVSKIKYGTEEFVIFNDIIFFYCPEGYGRSKLNNNFFENKLKVVATTRNWKTTIKLLEMAQDISN